MAIRKYSKSRRLYDTEAGHYLTIEDIRPRILGGETVTTPSNDDCTDKVLVKVIVRDIENGEGPTVEELRMFIMSYSAPKIIRPSGLRAGMGSSK